MIIYTTGTNASNAAEPWSALAVSNDTAAQVSKASVPNLANDTQACVAKADLAVAISYATCSWN